jgi:hypothetical protein
VRDLPLTAMASQGGLRLSKGFGGNIGCYTGGALLLIDFLICFSTGVAGVFPAKPAYADSPRFAGSWAGPRIPLALQRDTPASGAHGLKFAAPAKTSVQRQSESCPILRLRGAGDASMRDMSTSLQDPAARLYALGGQTSDDLHLSTVESICLCHPENEVWRTEPPMPRARSGMCPHDSKQSLGVPRRAVKIPPLLETGFCAAVLDGQLYVLGGHDNRFGASSLSPVFVLLSCAPLHAACGFSRSGQILMSTAVVVFRHAGT